MDRRNFTQLACAAGIASIGSASLAGNAKQPNLLIIHTDEHNFRTLGCYRELMTPDQAYVWGKGVKVDTPNIDSLARDGAIATSYYAASPVCTPSRAALVSGLYPVHTGSPSNDMPMHDGLVTFAEILRRNGYATSYLGKWHLDGDEKPGFAPARKFGWDDNRYMFNRGHWKKLAENASGPRVASLDKKGKPSYDLGDADEKTFTTDFLCDRTLEIIARDKAKPFCVMVSIPDPHGPNTVRAPYDTMFEHLHFENPRTMDVDEGTMPDWVNGEVDKLNQAQMARYFGMVKCIDDNVGKILHYLKSRGLDQNTIVVFTSDHGDLMGEHKKHNKGLPYETSACIPFIIRYPGKIPPGKVVHTAQCNVDFAPMALSLMGIKNGWPEFHGKDTSPDFLSPAKEVNGDRIVYLTNAGGRWVAAASDRYKLVLSPSDDPWLFDLQNDPDELVNFYTNPEYRPVAERMQAELVEQMKRYGEPALGKGNLIYETGGTSEGKTESPIASSEGYVVDAGGYAARGKKGAWTRAVTVPPEKFTPDSTYDLEIEWESKGLDEGADFFANFIAGKKDKANRQLETWKGAVGEAGVVRKELKTTSSNDWTLHVGVKDGGELVVKRIRIKKK
jgi:arylsulfatase A-like enzyme